MKDTVPVHRTYKPERKTSKLVLIAHECYAGDPGYIMGTWRRRGFHPGEGVKKSFL